MFKMTPNTSARNIKFQQKTHKMSRNNDYNNNMN